MQNRNGASNFAPTPAPAPAQQAGYGQMQGMRPAAGTGMQQGYAPRGSGSVAGLMALADLCNQMLEGTPRVLLAISHCAGGPSAPMGVMFPRK